MAKKRIRRSNNPGRPIREDEKRRFMALMRGAATGKLVLIRTTEHPPEHLEGQGLALPNREVAMIFLSEGGQLHPLAVLLGDDDQGRYTDPDQDGLGPQNDDGTSIYERPRVGRGNRGLPPRRGNPGFKLGDLFTDDELEKAMRIFRNRIRDGDGIQKVEREVVIPALPKINRVTGQENDSRYFAYLLQKVYHDRYETPKPRRGDIN